MTCTETGVPTCLWGTCVNATKCVCFEGYINDDILMEYDNCGLTNEGLDSFGGLALACCIIGAIVNAYVGRTTVRASLLRSLAVSAVLTNAFFTAFLADLLIYRHATIQSLVFYVAAIFCACFSFSYLFLSILLPVSRISRAIAAKFVPWRRFWLYFIPIFVSVGIIISFVGAFAFTPREDKRTFNNWLTGQAVMFIALVLMAAPAFTWFTGILIRGLTQALDLGIRMDEDDEQRSSSKIQLPIRRASSSNDADFGAAMVSRQALVKELLDKVLFIRRAVIVAGLTLGALATVTFALQIRFGTVPLFWAVLISAPFGVSLFTMEIAWYTRKKRESEKRRSTLIPFLADIGRQISSGMKRHSSKRLARFGSSRGSNANEKDLKQDGSPQVVHEKMVIHYRLDVPSTVKEEPSHLGASWAEGREMNSLKVHFAPDVQSAGNNEPEVVAADSTLQVPREVTE